MPQVNWLAVIVAALSTFVLGGLWYGPLFGRAWMRASGVDEARLSEGGAGRIFALSFVMQLAAAAVLALFVGDPAMGFTAVVAASASVGVFWVATAFAVVYLFERRPFSHWAVNAGYQVVAFTLMGLVLGAWR